MAVDGIKVKDEIMTPFINWLKEIHPGITVIVDRPNVNRPAAPYITVNILAPLQAIGSRDNAPIARDSDPGNTIFRMTGQRQFTMSVKAYEKGENKDFFDAQDRLIRVVNATRDPGLRATLRAAGLAVLADGAILDVTELIESGYEPRAQLDLIMGIAEDRETDLGAIENVGITGTVDGQTDPKFTVSKP